MLDLTKDLEKGNVKSGHDWDDRLTRARKNVKLHVDLWKNSVDLIGDIILVQTRKDCNPGQMIIFKPTQSKDDKYIILYLNGYCQCWKLEDAKDWGIRDEWKENGFNRILNYYNKHKRKVLSIEELVRLS